MRKPKKLKMKKDQSVFIRVNIDALPISDELKDEWREMCRINPNDGLIEITGLTESDVLELELTQ